MKRNYGSFYTLPLTIWITLFFVIPSAIIFLYSFLQSGAYGGVEWVFSLEAYKSLMTPTVLKIVWRTIWISIAVTAITLLIAVPTSYYIARSRHKTFLLFLIIIPFWTNFLIRIYSWIAILGNQGFINQFLIKLGMLTDPVRMLYNPYAVILITVYTYLPYAILPLYSTMEKFDFSLLEASMDLGASRYQGIMKVLIPNIKGGIITALFFVFIPSLGSYAIPQLVGGTNSMMLGNVIAREISVTRNWPLASSMSVILTLITTLGIIIFLRINRKGRTGGKK